MELVASDVREKTGCRIRFYESSDIVFDGKQTDTVRQQGTAPSHLDRLDQPLLPLDHTFYWNASGQHVTIFMMDAVCSLYK